MSEKKVVRRSVAIALGIICIVLVVVGLVGVFAYYMPMINEKDNKIHLLNIEIYQLNVNVTILQNQVTDLTSIVGLDKSSRWGSAYNTQIPPSSYIETTFSPDYAGYISIEIYHATSDIYVEVFYSSHGVNYDNTINVGKDGTACFPVLPSSHITIRVGTHSTSWTTIDTVTYTHYY
jgi:hypothetical protein